MKNTSVKVLFAILLTSLGLFLTACATARQPSPMTTPATTAAVLHDTHELVDDGSRKARTFASEFLRLLDGREYFYDLQKCQAAGELCRTALLDPDLEKYRHSIRYCDLLVRDSETCLVLGKQIRRFHDDAWQNSQTCEDFLECYDRSVALMQTGRSQLHFQDLCQGLAGMEQACSQKRSRCADEMAQAKSKILIGLRGEQIRFVLRNMYDDVRKAEDHFKGGKSWIDDDEERFVEAIRLCDRVLDPSYQSIYDAQYPRQKAAQHRDVCWSELWGSDRRKYGQAPRLPAYEAYASYPNLTDRQISALALSQWKETQSEPEAIPETLKLASRN